MKLLDVLKLIAPGTKLRAAIEEIVKARMGALLVVYSKDLEKIMEGGFEINCFFTPEKLVELCKMDGAVILSEDIKKILYANALLVPNPAIYSRETGTRHKAAERTAKQFSTLAIAISERKHTVTLYHGNIKYTLKPIEYLSRKIAEAIMIIEKQREIFEGLLNDLDILELAGLATLEEACYALQRAEIISRISALVYPYIIELGKEGIIAKMRLNELMKGIEEEKLFIVKDYMQGNEEETIKNLFSLSFEDILEIQNIKKCLGCYSDTVFSKGYRILNKLDISKQEVIEKIEKYGNLRDLLKAKEEELHEKLSRLREKAMRKKI